MPRGLYEKKPSKWLKDHGFKKRADGIWVRDNNGICSDWCEPRKMEDGDDWYIEIKIGVPPCPPNAELRHAADNEQQKETR